MDAILARVTQQAMNYAIRSGIAITSGFAIQQCNRLLKTQKGQEHDELAALQARLQSKIQIISPAIDMIELISARGNTSLQSAVTLTKALRYDIQELGIRLSKAAADEELARKGSSRDKSVENEAELFRIKSDMRKLLTRIEDAVPLISLAITTSGVSLSTNLPASISPSRLLQASTFLSAGDAQYVSQVQSAAHIGPTFTLSMYMLFSGHTSRTRDEEGLRNATWKEVIHKARVKLVRVALDNVYELPNFTDETVGEREAFKIGQSEEERNLIDSIPAARKADEFAYQLLIIEDLDDDRVHTFEEDEHQPRAYDDVDSAGICEIVPIHEVSKIFYADTGKILNIGSDGETNNPVLLLKRDVNAVPPRRMVEKELEGYSLHEEESRQSSSPANINIQSAASRGTEVDAQFAREISVEPAPEEVEKEKSSRSYLPPNLDPEWIAFEVFNFDPDSDSESEFEVDESEKSSSNRAQSSRQGSVDPSLTSAMSDLHLNSRPNSQSPTIFGTPIVPNLRTEISPVFHSAILPLSSSGPVRTSLSLLEMLIRLTSVQQFQQSSHLSINDELLNFFLEESSTTGAGPGDIESRKRIRMEARRRVGFDPYDESPIKRRGEEYQYHADNEWDQWSGERETDSPSSSRSSRQRNSPYRRYGAGVSTHSEQGTPLRDNRGSHGSLATPPSTTKSRDAFLRDEASRATPDRRSPLGTNAVWSLGDVRVDPEVDTSESKKW